MLRAVTIDEAFQEAMIYSEMLFIQGSWVKSCETNTYIYIYIYIIYI